LRCGKHYWPAVAFTFCVTFKRAINRPKTDPQLFFFSNFFINGQAYIISGTKIINFFSIGKGVQGIIIFINPCFNFTDTEKQLWNCYNIYESAVTITSPLKTITDPQKEIKMAKTDAKKVPVPVFLLLFWVMLFNYFLLNLLLTGLLIEIYIFLTKICWI